MIITDSYIFHFLQEKIFESTDKIIPLYCVILQNKFCNIGL